MSDVLNTIMCCDVIEGLKRIPDNSVHLIATSPPYNARKNYLNYSDDLSHADYLKWLEEVFVECEKKLVVGGRFVVNIDSMTNLEGDKDQNYIRCMYADTYNIMKKIGLKFRTEICWYKQNASGSGTSWGSYISCSNPVMRRNHEYVLVWSKGNYRLDGDSELSDMTKEEFCQYTLSVWNITPFTGKTTINHPAPFPEELAKRIIKLYSYRGNVVLDPFLGSGTTAYMSKVLHRNYIGIDICQEYCDYAVERIKKYDESIVLSGEEEYVPRSERIKREKELKQQKLEQDQK